LFCDGSAEEIVGTLVEECAAVGVRIFVGARVAEVRRVSGDGFVVRGRGKAFTTEFAEGTEAGADGKAHPVGTADGVRPGVREKDLTQRVQMADAEGAEEWEIAALAVVVATGGLSIPKMGATAFGYEVARSFGHSIVETRPGLVPLTFARGDARAFGELAGVSAMVEASCGGVSFREKMLFTHRGLSGPAILQASSYWGAGEAVRIDLAPELEWTAVFRDGKSGRDGGGGISAGKRRDLAAARTALRRILPQRLADRWIDRGVEIGKVGGDWTNAGLGAMEEQLHRWEVRPAGTEGYEKAEVTVGGVNTEELSSKTMESRLVPGLYFVGEVVDVTGWLGGFNFQWAWASGAAAGRAV
jgi:predicted Rossmann fold flavoprotein